MTKALPTRAELEHTLLLARQDVIACEDCADIEGATEARCRCDETLDALMHLLPEQR